jgi:hypothetical protein
MSLGAVLSLLSSQVWEYFRKLSPKTPQSPPDPSLRSKWFQRLPRRVLRDPSGDAAIKRVREASEYKEVGQ